MISDADKTRLAVDALRRRWSSILTITAVAGLGATAYAFVAPKWFESELAVVPTSVPKTPTGLMGAIAADLPTDLNLGGGVSADTERIMAVFKSRTVTDAVIQKFDLLKRYREPDIESARKAIWRHCSTKVEKKPSVVTLSCEDHDPVVAQQLAEQFGTVARAVLQRISASSAGEERRFLERRVAEAKRDVVSASEKLRAFQEKHRLVDLGEQSKAVVSAIASLQGELLSKQLQLSYLNQFSSEDEATATQLRRQVGVMEAKLKTLEDASNGSAAPEDAKTAAKGRGKFFPAAMAVPELRFELEQLYRDQKIQETLFLLLTQRYEMARVAEARDTSAFQILDEPIVATHKSRPKRGIIISVGLALGLLLGLTLVLYPVLNDVREEA